MQESFVNKESICNFAPQFDCEKISNNIFNY